MTKFMDYYFLPLAIVIHLAMAAMSAVAGEYHTAFWIVVAAVWIQCTHNEHQEVLILEKLLREKK